VVSGRAVVFHLLGNIQCVYESVHKTVKAARSWLSYLILVSIGYILYADDLLLLSPSVIGLQAMLDKCLEVAKVLSLEFNAVKPHCITSVCLTALFGE